MIRKSLKAILHGTGALRLLGRCDPARITVLLYHGLRRADGDPLRAEGDEKFTPVDLFEKQVRVCLSYGSVVSLEDAVSCDSLPPHPVVLTFDDGYENNWSLAFPLLRKYRVPATIFLTTGFVDGISFLWIDRFEHLVAKGPAGIWEHRLGGAPETLDLRTAATRIDTREAVKSRMKRQPPADIHRFLDGLQERWGIRYDRTTIPEPLRPLDWGRIREMEKSGLVEFGAHTVNHPILAFGDLEFQEREILGSKRRIEEELEKPCRTFAYPNGREGDFSRETVDVVRRCGYRAAVTTERGFLRPQWKEPLRIPRWGAPSTDADLAYLLTR